MATTMPAPTTFTDRDGTQIGDAYELEAGTLYALGDGGFMLAIDPVLERADLEALHALIGQVLQRGAAAGTMAD